jgi:hypothetical protein
LITGVEIQVNFPLIRNSNKKICKAAGLESSFTILDQSDSEDVINLFVLRQDLSAKKKDFQINKH